MSLLEKSRLSVAFVQADSDWTLAYEAICPRGAWPGDFRYTEAAKGAPGSELRRLYDIRVAAQAAWARA